MAKKKLAKISEAKTGQVIKREKAKPFVPHPVKTETETGEIVEAMEATANQPQFTDLPPMESHDHKYIRGTLPGNRLIKVCRYFGCGHTIFDISQQEFDELR